MIFLIEIAKRIIYAVVESVLGTLDSLIRIAMEKFDVIDEDLERKDSSPPGGLLGKILGTWSDYDGSSFCGSSATPTSVLPNSSSHYTSPLLLPLGVQAVGKLNPLDVKRPSFHKPPQAQIQDSRISAENNNIVDEIMEDEQLDKAPAANVEEIEKPKNLVTAPITVAMEPSRQPNLSPDVELASSPPTLPPTPDFGPNLTPSMPPPPPPAPILKLVLRLQQRNQCHRHHRLPLES